MILRRLVQSSVIPRGQSDVSSYSQTDHIINHKLVFKRKQNSVSHISSEETCYLRSSSSCRLFLLDLHPRPEVRTSSTRLLRPLPGLLLLVTRAVPRRSGAHCKRKTFKRGCVRDRRPAGSCGRSHVRSPCYLITHSRDKPFNRNVCLYICQHLPLNI